jgi:NADPH-dependent glutamate synthase beta subunit-like oxidoreductase
MKTFKHSNARSLEEAASLLRQYPGRARVVAGGTDLIGEMKDHILADYPLALVNIKTIPGLDFIRDEGQKVVIGALTRLEDIAVSEIVKKKLPMLAAAAAGTASPHIREMGTLGGNLSQSNRCWYYWVPENRFDCLRKGGKNCFAQTGDGRYHAIFGGVRVAPTPCTLKCPDQIEIADYMGKIREADMAAAAQILLRRNPLPAITGRVCPHTCESECNRQETDQAVSIRAVERCLGDYVLNNSDALYKAPVGHLNKTVAVLGSGPCGLTAAYYLRRLGYAVTILENMEQAGGLLTYGIPAYRLPKDVVRKQVAVLAAMGIQIKTKAGIDSGIQLKSLLSEYNAVLAACGAWKERAAGLPGEELMISASHFLRQANIGGQIFPGKKVAVIGGGNVAIDAARTLLRMGSEAVIVYRRGKNEMPALPDEVQKTEEEGIRIQYLTLPVAVSRSGARLALKCQKMELGAPDASGRPRPIAIPGSDFTEEFDSVMTAIGEEPDTAFLSPEYKNSDHCLKFDLATSKVADNLFAGGDFVSGPSTVVAAIASGRQAAAAINRYLKGPETPVDDSPQGCQSCSTAIQFNSQFLNPAPRNETTELPVEIRVKQLEIEEAAGLDRGAFENEANRCLNCSCVAVNPSDTAPALIVLEAKIVTTKRVIEAEEFFTTGINRSTVLEDDEIVKEIVVPVPTGARSVFNKFALRKTIDFPVVNIAAAIRSEQGVVKSARICLNSVFNQPLRAKAAEALLIGNTVDAALAEKAARVQMAKAFPLVNNQYKINIAQALIKRTIIACTQGE